MACCGRSVCALLADLVSGVFSLPGVKKAATGHAISRQCRQADEISLDAQPFIEYTSYRSLS